MSKLKQREANRAALMNAASIIEGEDFGSLFGEDYGFSDNDAEQEHNDIVMHKAQAAAVQRILRLAGNKS